MSIKCKDFLLTISASDLVKWIGDEDKDCVANPYLVTATNLIGITLDPVHLYNQFFDRDKAGSGDVYLYKNHQKEPSYFSIDMYRGMTDQLDITQIAIRAEVNQAQVKVALRSFFDTVDYQVQYEESCSSTRVKELVNTDIYPKRIEETGYMQSIHEIKNC